MTNQTTQPEDIEVDASSGTSDTNSESPRRMAYQSPTFKIDRLTLITQGGSVDISDSGETGTQGQPIN